ncbi:hypothetical protein BOX15_Mlig008074g5, partial [Macrostomum lignano]
QSRVASTSCYLVAAAACRPAALPGCRLLLQPSKRLPHCSRICFQRNLATGNSTATSAAAGVLSETQLGVYLPAPEGLVNAKISAGVDPSLAELGLATSAWPADLVQRTLEWLHCSAELPWWAGITAFVVSARILLFPVMVMHRRNCNLYINALSSQQTQTATLLQAVKAGRMEEAEWLQKQLTDQMHKQTLPLLKRVMACPLLAFLPVFGSTFYALNRLSTSGLPSLESGGAFWFADLTLPDPYLGLPVLSIATTYAMLLTGSEMPQLNKLPGSKFTKTLLFGLPLVALPLAMHFSAAVVYFWSLNNVLSLAQGTLLKRPGVAKALNIPQVNIGRAFSGAGANPLAEFREIFDAKRGSEMPRVMEEQMRNLRDQRQQQRQQQQQSSGVSDRKESSGKN